MSVSSLISFACYPNDINIHMPLSEAYYILLVETFQNLLLTALKLCVSEFWLCWMV